MQRQRKLKKMMATDKEIKDARGHRAHYAGKINTCIKQNKDLVKFNKLSIAELQEIKNELTRLMDVFDEKCLALGSVDADSGTAAADEQIDIDCAELKGRIAKRMAELALPLSNPSTVQSVGQPPVLQQVTSDIASHSVSTTDPPNSLISSQSSSNVASPIFTFGQFKGSLGDWHRFAKRFKSEVKDNDQLNASRKLELLLNACDDNAKAALNLNSGDFESNWNQLEAAFGESYAQFHFCLSKILETAQQTLPSAEGIKHIRARGDKCVEILSEHGRSKEIESMLVVYLASKLDNETSRAWDRYRLELAKKWAMAAETNEKRSLYMHIPTWLEFSEFLQGELDIFLKQQIREATKNSAPSQNVANNSSRNVERGRSSSITSVESVVVQVDTTRMASGGAIGRTTDVVHRAPSNDRNVAPRLASTIAPESLRQRKSQAPIELQCKLCTGIHMAYHCDRYKEMTFDDKWRFVSQANLCVRCFCPLHETTPCNEPKNNKACKYCWGLQNVMDFHNGTLCPTKFRAEPFPLNLRSPPPPMPQTQRNVPVPGRYR